MMEFLRQCQVLERASLSREKKDISNRAKINDHEKNDGDNQRFSSNSKSQNITLLLTTFQEKKMLFVPGIFYIFVQ